MSISSSPDVPEIGLSPVCNVWAAPDLGSGRRPAAERALKKALRTQRVVLVHIALTLDGPHPRRSRNQIRYAALKRRWQSVGTSRSGAAQIYIPGDVVITTCTYCRRGASGAIRHAREENAPTPQ